MPVFQVVHGFVACAREVGNFVPVDSACGEMVEGGFVEVRDLVIGGDVERAVAFSAEQNFGAEAAILIDFEHVDGDVGDFEGDGCLKRLLPRLGGLAGEAGY